MAAFVLLACSGCAIFGNTGPVEIVCSDESGRQFQFTLPMGSGRSYPQGPNGEAAFDLPAEHPCGPMRIQEVKQGEDRSGGLLGIIGYLLTGGW